MRQLSQLAIGFLLLGISSALASAHAVAAAEGPAPTKSNNVNGDDGLGGPRRRQLQHRHLRRQVFVDDCGARYGGAHSESYATPNAQPPPSPKPPPSPPVPATVSVPEPSSIILLSLGLLAAGMASRGFGG